MGLDGPIDVSVVVATCKRPRQVLEAVHSALAQEGVLVEVIVVDDDPEAAARGPIESIGDGRVRYVRREQPSGGVPALVYNEGLGLARGRAVLFLDDDDLALPGALRSLLAALDGAPEAALAFGLAEPFGGPPEVMVHETAFFFDAARRARTARSLGTRYLLAQLLFGSTLFVVSGCLFHAARLRELSGFSPHVRIQPHLEAAARCARRYGWTMVDEAVVRYRVQAGSLIHDQKNLPDLRRSYDEMYKSFRAAFGFFEYARLKLYARAVLRD